MLGLADGDTKRVEPRNRQGQLPPHLFARACSPVGHPTFWASDWHPRHLGNPPPPPPPFALSSVKGRKTCPDFAKVFGTKVLVPHTLKNSRIPLLQNNCVCSTLGSHCKPSPNLVTFFFLCNLESLPGSLISPLLHILSSELLPRLVLKLIPNKRKNRLNLMSLTFLLLVKILLPVHPQVLLSLVNPEGRNS